MTDPNTKARWLKSMYYGERDFVREPVDVCARIDKCYKDELKRIAELKRISLSGVVREAIYEYLNKVGQSKHKEETK